MKYLHSVSFFRHRPLHQMSRRSASQRGPRPLHSQNDQLPLLQRNVGDHISSAGNFLFSDHSFCAWSIYEVQGHCFSQSQQSEPHLHPPHLPPLLLPLPFALHRRTWKGELPPPTNCIWHHLLCGPFLRVSKNHYGGSGFHEFQTRIQHEEMDGEKTDKFCCTVLFLYSSRNFYTVVEYLPSLPRYRPTLSK